MDAMKRVGLNTRWYRYQKGLTQEKFSDIAKSLGIDVELLFSEKTANKAIDLPMRVYMYKK